MPRTNPSPRSFRREASVLAARYKRDRMSQPDLDQTELAKRLYPHYREATIVDYARVAIEAAWQPWAKECHANATTWAAHNSGWSAVRGWLVFDFSYLPSPFIRFPAHSVVQDPDGKLWDITPPALEASRQYPFFRHPGTADEFRDFVERHGLIQVDHFIDQ
jgi:hypothetical protein